MARVAFHCCARTFTTQKFNAHSYLTVRLTIATEISLFCPDIPGHSTQLWYMSLTRPLFFIGTDQVRAVMHGGRNMMFLHLQPFLCGICTIRPGKFQIVILWIYKQQPQRCSNNVGISLFCCLGYVHSNSCQIFILARQKQIQQKVMQEIIGVSILVCPQILLWYFFQLMMNFKTCTLLIFTKLNNYWRVQ